MKNVRDLTGSSEEFLCYANRFEFNLKASRKLILLKYLKLYKFKILTNFSIKETLFTMLL